MKVCTRNVTIVRRFLGAYMKACTRNVVRSSRHSFGVSGWLCGHVWGCSSNEGEVWNLCGRFMYGLLIHGLGMHNGGKKLNWNYQWMPKFYKGQCCLDSP
jgi:hypothetical protein